MIRAAGWSPNTYKMPSKLIEQGLKFHRLADHGYIWDFHPTSIQAGRDPVPSTNGLTATGEVVYHLLQKLPSTMYFIVSLDNFYTTVPLLGSVTPLVLQVYLRDHTGSLDNANRDIHSEIVNYHLDFLIGSTFRICAPIGNISITLPSYQWINDSNQAERI